MSFRHCAGLVHGWVWHDCCLELLCGLRGGGDRAAGVSRECDMMSGRVVNSMLWDMMWKHTQSQVVAGRGSGKLPGWCDIPGLHKVCILFSCGCRNKLTQTGDNRNVFSQFWRPRVQNQGESKAVLSPKAPRGNFPCLFQLMVAIGIPWLGVASVQSMPPFSEPSLFVCLLLFCLWLSHLALDSGLTLMIQGDLISRSLI